MASKITTFLRGNERTVITAALVLLLLLSASLLIINKNHQQQSAVPMPFENLERPEEAAIKVGDVVVTRRTLKAWQERDAQGSIQGPAYAKRIARLPDDQKSMIKSSVLEFCQQYYPGPSLATELQHDKDGQQWYLLCEMSRRDVEPAAANQIMWQSVAAAEYLSRHKKLPAARLEARTLTLTRALKAQYGSNIETGLSVSDIKAAATGQVAAEILLQEANKADLRPSFSQLQQYMEKHSDNYARPALYSPTTLVFPTEAEADKAYKLLTPTSSRAEAEKLLSEKAFQGGIQPVKPYPLDGIYSSFRKGLTQDPPGTVLPPAFAEYVWQVLITGQVRPAQPLPALSRVKEEVRNDYLSSANARNLSELQTKLDDRWGASVICDTEIADSNPNLNCGRLSPS
jgi:hypothetical protein